ncbi:hypothetical protein [Erwinia typographi]|uniref:hypothetical protein n=1 Tax=Erwinia typographi TaxID=371042 RepID=UPI0012ED14EE|nr:hypothetical protein [Erwinia typographi]
MANNDFTHFPTPDVAVILFKIMGFSGKIKQKNALQVRMIMIIIVVRSRDGLHGPAGKHDIAHIASKYYLASSGAGFFLPVIRSNLLSRYCPVGRII